MSGNWPTSRAAIIDPQPSVHQTFHRIFAEHAVQAAIAVDASIAFSTHFDEFASYLLPGAGRRHQPFVLNHAYDGNQATELIEAAASAEQRFGLAFIGHAPAENHDALKISQELWRIDPNIQIVICLAEAQTEWPELAHSMPHADQLLLLRKPLHRIEVAQMALAQSARWRTTMEVREHIWRLQSELDRRLETEAKLRRDAEQDALTKLPNRVVLLQRLDEILRRYERGEHSIDAVLFMDLDNFKVINDTLGHAAGDELLNQVANRLRTSVRNGDGGRGRTETVRLGGDEFVVLLEQLSSPEDAVAVAKRIVDRVAEPFRIDERTVHVGSSIGVAFVDSADASGECLLQNADTAMYRAKLSGKGQVAVYDRDMHEDISARIAMENALRNAIANQHLDVLYQPGLSLHDGEVRSLEALLRWKMNDLHSIPPSRFIPLAEELGLITEIGYWAIDRATKQLAPLLTRRGYDAKPPTTLNFNLSYHQLWESDFEKRVGEILKANDFPRELLKLEITEEIAMRQPTETARRLYELHMAGFGICMDDFGAGHSSLAFFHQFPIEAVKIDRAFVGSIAGNSSHQAIVEAVVQLAHSLNATVVAEGLESLEQVQQLKSMGCDYGQGYCFAPPLPFAEIERILQSPADAYPWAEVSKAFLAAPASFEKPAAKPLNRVPAPTHDESRGLPPELPWQTLNPSGLPR
ncbi:putative bifunctional diguanylate cyclase/phosphodiesterase [Planctomycetaceae bacterium SH139]